MFFFVVVEFVLYYLHLRSNMDWMEEFRTKYNARLTEHTNSRAFNSTLLPLVKYQKIIDEVQNALSKTTGKQPSEYRKVKRFRLAEENGVVRLTTHPVDGILDTVKAYVYTEELFDILTDIHLKHGHLARDPLMNEIKDKYANLTRDVVLIYMELCPEYHDHFGTGKTRKRARKSDPGKPGAITPLRAQFDLIDCQFNPDGDYRFVLHYQEQVSKFCILKPIRDDSALSISDELFSIFTTIRIPTILYSTGEENLRRLVIAHLKVIWPELNILMGKASGTIQNPNRDIVSILSIVNRGENGSNWSRNLQIAQYLKNTIYHCSIKKSPYEAMFNRKPATNMHPKMYFDSLPKEIHDDASDSEQGSLSQDVQLQMNLLQVEWEET